MNPFTPTGCGVISATVLAGLCIVLGVHSLSELAGGCISGFSDH